MVNHPHRSKRVAATNDTGFPPTPGISSAAEKVISSLERGERLAAAYGREDRMKRLAPEIFAAMVALVPMAVSDVEEYGGDGEKHPAIIVARAIIAAVEGQ